MPPALGLMIRASSARSRAEGHNGRSGGAIGLVSGDAAGRATSPFERPARPRATPPEGQARETIRSPNDPLGAVTVTVSPARRPMSALPTGDVLLIRPCAGEASWLPTIV